MADRKFWQIRNSADGESAELLLYGPISESTWWGDEVTPKQFADDLAALGDVKQLKVRINSYGGDVFAATAIYNALRNHSARITAYVDGIAASSASVIAMAGDTVTMPSTAMMMIHNPWSVAMGDARDLRATADVLDKVRDSIVAAYSEKTGLERSRLLSLLNAETWMTAAEAMDMGFADEIDEQAYVEASISGRMLIVNGLGFGLDKFRTLPAAMLARGKEVATMGAQTEKSGIKAEVEEPKQPAEERVAQDPEAPIEPEAPAAPAEPAAQVSTEVLAERKRIADIQALARPGAEDIITKAIGSGASPGEVALEILNSQSVKRADALADRRADARQVGSGGGTQTSAKERRVGLLVSAFRAVRGSK